MGKTFTTEFDMESGEGIVDIAIRTNTKNGQWEFAMEENGVPVTLPQHILFGILVGVMKNC